MATGAMHRVDRVLAAANDIPIGIRVTRTPDKPKAPTASRSSGRRRAARALAPANILLVDDHPPNLMALEAILEPLGERLVRASSGVEAVEIAAHEDFALVLLDLQMPELDGLETAALLKKAERSHAVPIIIVTANEPSRDTLAKGYASGAVDFLFKPLDPDVLRSKVAVFVDLYKQRAARDSDPSSHRSSRPSATTRVDEGSGRVSERLIAASPSGEQAETVEALVRIHSALNEDLDLAGIAQRLVDETTSLTAANAGAFHWSARGEMHVALSGTMRSELTALGPGSSLMTRVFGGVGALRIEDASRELGPRAPKGIRSALAVPVLSRGGHVVGALVLVSDRARAFDDRDEELAAVAARHAAAALENARLYEEAKDARRRAELAELELRAGEARVRLALDSAGLGTFDYNPTTGALRWDTRSRALFGLPPDALVSYSLFISGIHPEDRARVDAAHKRALDPYGDGDFDIEYRTLGLKDAVARWVAAKGQTFAENGRAVRFVGTFLDVTAKKIVEQERAALLAREQEARAEAESARARAEAASRAKDEFLATVSHELRNPLNAILGWSRVLLEEGDDLPKERRLKGLEVIARNAKAQVQLVEDILEVSRIVSGKLRLATGPVDIRSVVEASFDTVRSAAQAKGVVLENRIEEGVGSIIADEDRIQQVLWNLLSNAVKFTPRGGSVRLDARRDAEGVVLSVVDTGEGVEPTFLPFVFERFRQADGSSTRSHGGLGLGLAIVRHLCELHGGTVQADSEGMGKGATFTVRLPIHAVPQSERAPDRVAPSKPGLDVSTEARLADVHVLVLDDEEDMRDLISMILEHAGARVTRVNTVEAALKALAIECPHVAVSDLAMPGEDGYAFVKRVRAADDVMLRNLPLVAMTAYARAEDRHRVLAAGFQRHVAKPIEPAELVEALAEVAAATRPVRGSR
ncbi:MAG: Chemotaxis protein methyltransferase CheR [Myxococcaceae bacterium]|nr:Chemotaxis protein methyltransferase CheR [Myxococcaceae bacterium]